jgi:hypothetical protein
MAMKIEFCVDGGFAHLPGLAKPVTIDCAALPPAHGARLARLVERARFFDAPAPAAPAGARDARSYTLAIDDGRRRRSLTLAEPIADAGMRELVDAVSDSAREMRGGVRSA